MRLKFTKNKITKLINTGLKQSITIAQNTILEIQDKGIATFHFRGQVDNKRKKFKIGTYGENNAHLMSIEDAIEKASDMKRLTSESIDPSWAVYSKSIKTVDDLFMSFFQATACSYKDEKRIYHNYIKPEIGHINIKSLCTKHLQVTLKSIVDQGVVSIAKRTLYFFRSVFSDAFENNVIKQNVARNLDFRKHVGATTKDKGIALTELHLNTLFDVSKQHPLIFPETTIIAITLLLIFGFRKMELLAAQWSDIDWEEKEFHIWTDYSKNKLAISVPIPDSVIPIFKRLELLANGSDYLFPSRRRSKTPHIHDSTINASINNLFTSKLDSESLPKQLKIPYFKVHDFRRTFRSLLPKYDVINEVAEACLNHKPRGIVAVYNRYQYLEQRRVAHDKMAKIILPMAGFEYLDQKLFNTSRECKTSQNNLPMMWENNCGFKIVA